MSVTPWAASQRAIRRTSGSPPTGIAGLARTLVSGRRRVPSPAVRIIPMANREFLTIFLIAEPGVKTELLEQLDEDQPVADIRLDLLTHLDRRRLHRSLEGDQATSRFDADPQGRSLQPQRHVGRVQQAVV